MKDGYNLLSGLACSAGALQVSALEAQVAAFNIANMSTSAFRPLRLDAASGFHDQGTRATGLRREHAAGQESMIAGAVPEEGSLFSGTDLAVEFTHLIEAKNSFTANARVIGTLDELAETVINLKA